MAHLHRFHCESVSPGVDEVSLSPEESHHALHVVRARAGEAVALFDGQGGLWRGTVSRASRREVCVRIEAHERVPKPSPRVTLAQAWLHRGKSVDFLIQHGTGVGVDRFVFFRAARSEHAPRLNPKWGRMAIEACKQCGRLWLPEFAVADDLGKALAEGSGDLLIAAMHATPVPLAQALSGGDATLAVGPEGDFTEEELGEGAALGAQPISLGETTFRSEVAAVLGVSLIAYELGGLGPSGR